MLVISSSGNSENIIRAVKVVKEIGMKIIGFSGFDKKNRLNAMSDISVFVNGATYGEVE